MSDKPRVRFLEKLKLEGAWDNMSPKQRQGAVVVGGLAGLFLLLATITQGGGETKQSNARESVKRSVLTDTDTRSIGIDALNAKVKGTESDVDRLAAVVAKLSSELEEERRRRGNDPAVTKELELVKSQLHGLTSTAKSLGWDVDDLKDTFRNGPIDYAISKSPPSSGVKKINGNAETQADQVPPPVDDISGNVASLGSIRAASNDQLAQQDPSYYFRTAPVRPATPGPTGGAADGKNGTAALKPMKLVTVESEPSEPEEDETGFEISIPAGSILSGVSLNGLDAATGRGARKDPFPVLVRIQSDAVLPNEYRADVKECFATAAGYGEMSSERAYLRGEMFSCITKHGDVIEVNLPAYAVGEDGKAGIRGRLVTKAGALIARTALAGFAAGVAEAFDSSPVPVIQTGQVTNDKVYQDNFSKDAANHGMASGASAAMTRVADYYMDMADQIFPVIEVDAGRQVDLVLTTGIKLSTKNAKQVAKSSAKGKADKRA